MASDLKPMFVGDLIAELQKHDPTAVVITSICRIDARTPSSVQGSVEYVGKKPNAVFLMGEDIEWWCEQERSQ